MRGTLRDPLRTSCSPIRRIYDVALWLLDVAPLRIQTRSKSERGCRLIAADGGTPPAVQMKPVILDPAMTQLARQEAARACPPHATSTS